MKKIPLVLQMNQTECGLCCVTMLLNFYGNAKSIYELRKEHEIGRDGMSFTIMKEIFKREKIAARIFKSDIDAVYQINQPAILFWNNNHFVILEKCNKKYARIIDPAIGRRKVSLGTIKENFSEYLLLTEACEDFEKEKTKLKNPWFQILSLIQENKKVGLIFLTLAFVSMFAQLLTPVITQNFIDMALELRQNSVLHFLILSIILCFTIFVLGDLRGKYLVKLNVSLSKKLTTHVFRHLLYLPYKYFDLRSPGDLLFRLSCVTAIRDLLSSYILPGVVNIGMAISIFIYLYYKSIWVGIVATFIVLINMMFLLLTRKSVGTAVDMELSAQSKNQSEMTEILYSIMFIKMNNLEDTFLKKWSKTFREALCTFGTRADLQNVVESIRGAFQTFSTLLILAIGIVLFQNNRLTVGEVIALQTISSTLFSQVNVIFSSYTQFILADSYLKRILDIILYDKQEEPLLDENEEKLEINNITFRDVKFKYSTYAQDVLYNIDLNIEKGEKVGIVGESGSGKSTLAKLLVGLYEHSSGEIKVNDRSIHEINKNQLHEKVGIVPQDLVLFNKSILENITIGLEDFSMDEVIEVAKIANIHDEIEQMPMSYQTVVNDMGQNLSGGQRQRITLARTLLRKPELLLLDEATSSLDMYNEKIISDYLRKINCTCIVIAHRLSTIIDADKIYVMNRGKIVGSGTHEFLLRKNIYYKKLYSQKREKKVYGGESYAILDEAIS